MSEEIPPWIDSSESRPLTSLRKESQTVLPGFLTELETPETDNQDQDQDDMDDELSDSDIGENANLFSSLNFYPLPSHLQDPTTPYYGDIYEPYAYSRAVLTTFPDEDKTTYEIDMLVKPPVTANSTVNTKQLLLNEYNVLTRSFMIKCVFTSGDKAAPLSHAFRCSNFQECDYCWDIHECACYVLKTFRNFVSESEYRQLYFS